MFPDNRPLPLEIYHPPVSTNRLEGEYYADPNRWAPTIHYKNKLDDIRSQRTPSEQYKYELQLRTGAAKEHERLLARINRNFELWNSSAERIQACYKGCVARRGLMEKLRRQKIDHLQSVSREEALRLFSEGKGIEALAFISKAPEQNSELLIMKAKIMYSLSNFEECESAARQSKELDPENTDSRYLIAASFAARNKLNEAYDELKASINLIGPTALSCKLRAYICVKISPPKYDQAKLDFDYLVETHPEDLNLLVQRACALSGLQNWDAMVSDLSTVLLYEPRQTQVRCMRARAYACKREWELARKDYKDVLFWLPDDYTALNGLAEIDQLYEELPMLDLSLVEDS